MARPTLHTRSRKARRGDVPAASRSAVADVPSASEGATGDGYAPGAQPDGATAIRDGERQAMISQAAYYRAERRGFEPGHEVEDWLAAEQDIERILPREILPASAVD